MVRPKKSNSFKRNKKEYKTMNEIRKYNKPVSFAPVSREADPDDIENEKWNPTPAALEAFFARDMQFAQTNIRTAMSGKFPMSLRDLKESCLHSIDVIERTLTSKIASGEVSEVKGRYSLVK